ncbi:MAG: hypothetical protein HOY78_36160 [Saccharothrix sp.]|nr:hypothetical protein [Saccharothrix sp.]
MVPKGANSRTAWHSHQAVSFVPPGGLADAIGFTARHPEGTVVEDVHHRPQSHER